MADKQKTRDRIIIAVVVIVALLAFYYFSSKKNSNEDCLTPPANEMNIMGHKNLALHIHPELIIQINGENQTIPANMGLFNNVIRPIHTHDEPGILHIESLCSRVFRLGEFFSIWGKTFNQQCIFEYCADKGDLKMHVNGKENMEFQDYIMQDNDKILIEYNSK